ncbi:hypothetical protein ACHQM5_005915 [Ranunculus cassubicifolius]
MAYTPPPPPWYMPISPNPVNSSSFWTKGNLQNQFQHLRDTIDIAKAMKEELEGLALRKELLDKVNIDDGCGNWILDVLKEKKMSFEMQESVSLEAVNALIMKLRGQIEPFGVVTSETCLWEEKSAVARLEDKIRKCKRNKLWRKRKRQRNGELRAKERERFDVADQEADEWRAREIAKDIAKRKVEKMKEIARHKANEERKKLESELELVLIVEKLQELRSIRIQKLKKQGHFLPEEDDKFLESVRAAVEEEERQVAAAADTDAAKDAIATAEESRKDGGVMVPSLGGGGEVVTENDTAEQRCEQSSGGEGTASASASGSGYGSVGSLPVEFYHYYHGSNTDMGTLIEVRREWDAYIRPGGSRIPGHLVEPPPPANEIWESYLLNRKTD